MKMTGTHAIGNIFMKKLMSSRNPNENFGQEASESSSSSSSFSFKQICKGWKPHIKSVSIMSLDKGIKNRKKGSSTNTSTAKDDKQAEFMQKSSEDDYPHELSMRVQRFFKPDEIRQAFTVFKMYDANDDNHIELHGLKLALEKLSVPQTHLAARELMDEIVGRRANKMNFYQFMNTYTSILEGTNQKATQISDKWDLEWPKEPIKICTSIPEANVSRVKLFFETKIAEQSPDQGWQNS